MQWKQWIRRKLFQISIYLTKIYAVLSAHHSAINNYVFIKNLELTTLFSSADKFLMMYQWNIFFLLVPIQLKLFLWHLFVTIILTYLFLKYPFLLKAIANSSPLTIVLPWPRAHATYWIKCSCFFVNYSCPNYPCTISYYVLLFL